MKFDVAIIGGGPGGATCGAFLRKYKPGIKVGIFEREFFPRDHIGESQLPVVGTILNELGVWDKVEAAQFPVKIGATYRWGTTEDLWDFHFLPNGEFHDAPRPSRYHGQRTKTAFQVDRAVYDKILLDHARELGCEAFEGSAVREVLSAGDKVTGLVLDCGQEVQARHYVDASGHSGLLRRAMGVQIEEPSSLRNVAFWDYWQNAEWAVTVGVGGTRVQIMSLGYGWLWFIPLSPTRTSIGLVCPADYYKKSGQSPQALYMRAVKEDPRIKLLIENAEPEGKFATTKDWSFVAERMTGENWMLVGESSGFADPILAAGLSLTHASAREAAFTMLELDRGGDPQWLKEQYFERNKRRVLQHIRFADYWYAGNRHFKDLKEYTSEIARDAGLEMDGERAFQWLGTGGFIEEDIGVGGFGTISLGALHQIAIKMSGDPGEFAVGGYNGFALNFEGATRFLFPNYQAGQVLPVHAYRRGAKVLPLNGLFGYVVKGLERSPRIFEALEAIEQALAKDGISFDRGVYDATLECLEAMVRDGWVDPRRYKTGQTLSGVLTGGRYFQENRDVIVPKG